MIAALYVAKGGIYWNRPDVDAWDKSRDARLYAGPYPVVAHPPCQRWSQIGAASFARWGGEHNRPGNDGGCFVAALEAVRTWGGVIEHPAKSLAWDEFRLPKPRGVGWIWSGDAWVCEVWQSAYGHRARKATWLYLVTSGEPAELNWSRTAGECQVGFQDKRGKLRNKPVLSKAESNSTPPAFAEALIDLARNSRTAVAS